MPTVLLLGRNGHLGWELQRTLAPLGGLVALGRAELDLEDLAALRRTVREARPGLIVNAAAYTNVDGAEAEPSRAHAINATAPSILAEEARALGAALIHFSTDFVFDGAKGAPYSEDDSPNPLNVYGKSKLAGEQGVAAVGGAFLILRTSWVYSLRRESFVTKVLEWSRRQETLRIVEDQVGSPTWARALAEATARLIAGDARERSGVFHLSGSGQVSRFGWAEKIVALDPDRAAQKVRRIEPARSADFATPARRPSYSALSCGAFESAFGFALPNWEESLRQAMSEA